MTFVFSIINNFNQKKVQNLNSWPIIKGIGEISTIVEQGDVIWAGGRDGVFEIDRFNFSIRRKLETDIKFEYVKALLVDKSGVLWIGHINGLTRYDGTSFYTYNEENGLRDKRVNALLEDTNDRLWIGTWRGCAILEHERWTYLSTNDGLSHEMVNVIYEDTRGSMWFGSYVAPAGGISCLHKGGRQIFSVENGLPHNNITDIKEDSSGNVWIGAGLLDRGGACRFIFSDGKWELGERLNKKDGLAGEKVRSIFCDDNGGLWFGSEYDGIAYNTNGKWSIYTEKDGLSHNEVKCIIKDAEGNLWLGTYDGITVLVRHWLDKIIY